MSNELKTTKEKILKAASTSDAAREALRKLFPEAFEDAKYFDLSKLKACDGARYLYFSNESSLRAGFFSNTFIQIRNAVEYRDKAFYLDKSYNWEIVKDSMGMLCLLPTKK